MTNKTEILKTIRHALGLEPTLPKAAEFAVESVTVDGIKITADAFEAGNPLLIVAEDGTTSPAAEGTYTTAEMVIMVDAQGMISEVKAPEAIVAAEEVTVETPEVEVEMDPAMVAVLDAIKALADKITAIETEIASMKTAMTKTEETMSKFSKEPGTSKIKLSDTLNTEAPTKQEQRIEKLRELSKNIRTV